MVRKRPGHRSFSSAFGDTRGVVALFLEPPRTTKIVSVRPLVRVKTDATFPVVRFVNRPDRLTQLANGAAEDFLAVVSGRFGSTLPDDVPKPGGTGTAKLLVSLPNLVSVMHTASLSLGGPYPSEIVDLAVVTDLGGPPRRIPAGAMFLDRTPWEKTLVAAIDAARKKRGAPPVAASGGLPKGWASRNFGWEPEGIRLVFAPGEIGPRVLGGDDVRVPWRGLKAWLRPSFRELLP